LKIAVSSEGTDLEARVARKFGTAPYFAIIDPDSNYLEVVPNPGASSQRGAGMQAVVLAVSKGIQTVLTGYCSPVARRQLEANGIEVLSDLSGTVKEVVKQYQEGTAQRSAGIGIGSRARGGKIGKVALAQALRSSARQFINMLPILIGVVLLIGLFNALVPKDFLASIFSGNAVLDTLWGTCLGSIFAGNAINSYVIGQELLTHGVSLFALTALIVSWVTVGLIQLPAEIAALGRKFALLRNALSFVISIPIAILTVSILNIM